MTGANPKKIKISDKKFHKQISLFPPITDSLKQGEINVLVTALKTGEGIYKSNLIRKVAYWKATADGKVWFWYMAHPNSWQTWQPEPGHNEFGPGPTGAGLDAYLPKSLAFSL